MTPIPTAARLARVHPNTVRRWLHRGDLSASIACVNGRAVALVDVAEVRRLAAAQGRDGDGELKRGPRPKRED